MLDLCKNKMCEQTSYIAYCSYSKPDKINQLVYCKDCKVQFKNTLIWVKGMFIYMEASYPAAQVTRLAGLKKHAVYMKPSYISVYLHIIFRSSDFLQLKILCIKNCRKISNT